MKKRLFLSILLAVGMAAGSANAMSFTVSTTVGGEPANASADFAFTATTLSITLNNTAGVGDLDAINSVLSGISFGLSGVTGLTLTGAQAGGTAVAVDKSTPIVFSTTTWTDNATFFGWTLAPESDGDWFLAAGAGTFKPNGIVNLNLESEDGIPNGPHNPYLLGPVTFTFGLTGTAPDVETAAFWFGTGGIETPGNPGEGVPPVPIPGTVLLLGSGLGGLSLLGRRKGKGR